MEILENPGKGQKVARRGQKRPGEARKARRGQEEARRGQGGPEQARKGPRRGQEEARKRPEEARKRPGTGQEEARVFEKRHQNAKNPEFGEKLLETQCFMNRK